jgi:hypothetical protein
MLPPLGAYVDRAVVTRVTGAAERIAGALQHNRRRDVSRQVVVVIVGRSGCRGWTSRHSLNGSVPRLEDRGFADELLARCSR